MSLAAQEDVFWLGEEVLSAAFEEFAPRGAEVAKAPYPVFSYRPAMLEFGCDKPDLRNPHTGRSHRTAAEGSAYQGEGLKAYAGRPNGSWVTCGTVVSQEMSEPFWRIPMPEAAGRGGQKEN